MSMQRILQSARKLGTPIIVTDPVGREPMVILPLEQFESMAMAQSPQERVYRKETPEPVQVPIKQEEEIPVNQAALPVKPVDHAAEIERLTKEINNLEGVPLEERFYLEPVADQAASG